MTSTAVETVKQTPVAKFRGELTKMEQQIQSVLPKHVDLHKFTRVVMTAVQAAPNLLTLDRQSLFRACVEAATDGLVPDGREGALVPYAGKVQWLPMVWGIVKLVRQSGELETLSANVVRDGDEFDHWVDEHGEHFKHRPAYSAEDRPLKLVYAFARTKDGGVYFEAMGAAEIEKFRKLSKAKGDSPWSTWHDEMAKVRAIKRLCKRLPLAVDAIAAIERDNLRDAEMLGQAPKASVIDLMNQTIVGAEPEKDITPDTTIDAPETPPEAA